MDFPLLLLIWFCTVILRGRWGRWDGIVKNSPKNEWRASELTWQEFRSLVLNFHFLKKDQGHHWNYSPQGNVAHLSDRFLKRWGKTLCFLESLLPVLPHIISEKAKEFLEMKACIKNILTPNLLAYVYYTFRYKTHKDASLWSEFNIS